jgi:hypothetical protein
MGYELEQDDRIAAGEESVEFRNQLAELTAVLRAIPRGRRPLAVRLLASFAVRSDASHEARRTRERHERERSFEESQLAPGPELERRRREP